MPPIPSTRTAACPPGWQGPRRRRFRASAGSFDQRLVTRTRRRRALQRLQYLTCALQRGDRTAQHHRRVHPRHRDRQRRRVEVVIPADQPDTIGGDQRAEQGHRALNRNLGRLMATLGKPVLEEPDTHVYAFTTGDDPAEYREPDHQEAGQLVGPDQGFAKAAGQRAERHATEERRYERAADEQRRLVESAGERAKPRHSYVQWQRRQAVGIAGDMSGLEASLRDQVKVRRCAPRVLCPTSIRTWPARSPGRV